MKYYKGKPIGLWIFAVLIILFLIYYYSSPVLVWGMDPSSYALINFSGWLTIAGWISVILDIFLVYAVTIGFYKAKNWARLYTMIVLSIPAFFSVYFLTKAESFLFVGGGRFHAIGIALATAKPTIVADPFEERAYPIHDEVRRVLKQRWASISEAKEAKNYGVLIGLKSGQRRIGEALKIREKIRRSGRRATLLALREITSDALMQFSNIEAFVNTACPRLSLENKSSFLKPTLSLNEALVMLGEMDWEELCRKGWFEN